MAESRFIKTVTYGGYDKADVIRRLESLSGQVFGLKNELRETKFLLESSENGKDIQESINTALAEERAKLTELQTENDKLSTELKAAEDSNKKYEEEIKKLTASLADAEAKLRDANTQLAASKSEDEALALSAVFIEAKKSADMLESSAKEKAEKLEKSAAEAAEKSIAYANDEGAAIIYEAECKAAEIVADAKNSSSAAEGSYDDMRASLLSKVAALSEQLSSFREAIKKVGEDSSGSLGECEKLLKNTEDKLKEGGAPEHKGPVKYDPEYPERPDRIAKLDAEDAQKRKNELDKLRLMAESINGNKGKAPDDKAAAAEEEKGHDSNSSNSDNNKGGKIDLAALAKQAKSLKNK